MLWAVRWPCLQWPPALPIIYMKEEAEPIIDHKAVTAHIPSQAILAPHSQPVEADNHRPRIREGLSLEEPCDSYSELTQEQRWCKWVLELALEVRSWPCTRQGSGEPLAISMSQFLSL